MMGKVINAILLLFLCVSCRTKEDGMAKELYNAVYLRKIDRVQKALEEGANPDYCNGEAAWTDSNPLDVIAASFYDTYYSQIDGETIPDPAPDVAILKLLVQAGADVNKRPYIWHRVNSYNNRLLDQIRRDVIQKRINIFLADTNRVIEAFLKAGADPDKLGHPYPYSYDAIFAYLTDEQANEYFDQGTRAINVAIEKGISWESQVDLLLQYTKLDEDSLIAAKESGDPAMVEKINKLWEIQQKSIGY